MLIDRSHIVPIDQWKEANAYPSVSSAGSDWITQENSRWYWEFLRRSDDYIEAWNECSSNLETARLKKSLKNVFPPEAREAMRERLRDAPKIAASFRMKFMVNPTPEAQPLGLGPTMATLAGATISMRRQVISLGTAEEASNRLRKLIAVNPEIASRVMVLGFDLSWKVGDLKKAAETLLQEQARFYGIEQRTTRRKIVNNWAVYLRVLDAKHEKQSLTTIATAILKRDDLDDDSKRTHAHEVVKAAQNVQDNIKDYF